MLLKAGQVYLSIIVSFRRLSFERSMSRTNPYSFKNFQALQDHEDQGIEPNEMANLKLMNATKPC